MTTVGILKLRELSGQLIDPDIAIAIFERLPDAVVVVDAVGDIQLVNQQAEFLFGYHRREMFDNAIEMLIPLDVHSRHISHRENYMYEPRSRPMAHDLPLRARRKDGSEFIAEINLSPMATPIGLFIMAVIRRRAADAAR